MTFFEALKWGESCLKATSQEPETDSLRCLEAATALSKSQIFSKFQESLLEIHLATFHALIQKRATGCPLAYGSFLQQKILFKNQQLLAPAR